MAYTNRNGKATHLTRDGAGRLTGVTNANQEITLLGYNALSQVADLWDGRTNHTTWHYNQYGWLSNKVDALSREVLRYSYDANGQVTNRWTAQMGSNSYTWDAVGNLKTITYPQSSVSYAYDAVNRLKSMADALRLHACRAVAKRTEWVGQLQPHLRLYRGPANEHVAELPRLRLRL